MPAWGGGGEGGEGGGGGVEQVWEAAAAVAPENVGQNKQIGKHRVWWGGNKKTSKWAVSN